MNISSFLITPSRTYTVLLHETVLYCPVFICKYYTLINMLVNCYYWFHPLPTAEDVEYCKMKVLVGINSDIEARCQENAKMPIKKDLNTWPIESTPWNRGSPEDEIKPPRKEEIITVLTTPPIRNTSPPTEHRKSPPSRATRATRLRRAPTRLNVEPSRKTYDP
uniref:Uncharacterized protein n=1 Tax=Heterorhabditis bacteriophora TaxID=37862 RepID=A0A1I7X099_HETBA